MLLNFFGFLLHLLLFLKINVFLKRDKSKGLFIFIKNHECIICRLKIIFLIFICALIYLWLYWWKCLSFSANIFNWFLIIFWSRFIQYLLFINILFFKYSFDFFFNCILFRQFKLNFFLFSCHLVDIFENWLVDIFSLGSSNFVADGFLSNVFGKILLSLKHAVKSS